MNKVGTTARIPCGTSNITNREDLPTFCELGVIFGVRKGASKGCRLQFADVLRILRHSCLSNRCPEGVPALLTFYCVDEAGGPLHSCTLLAIGGRREGKKYILKIVYRF